MPHYDTEAYELSAPVFRSCKDINPPEQTYRDLCAIGADEITVLTSCLRMLQLRYPTLSQDLAGNYIQIMRAISAQLTWPE